MGNREFTAVEARFTGVGAGFTVVLREFTVVLPQIYGRGPRNMAVVPPKLTRNLKKQEKTKAILVKKHIISTIEQNELLA